MSRIFLVFLTLTIATVISFQCVHAQSDPKEQAIKELLLVMKTRENLETSLSTMKDTIKMNSPYFLKEIKVILARELEEKDVQQAAAAFNENDFGANRLYELFRYKFNLERVENEIMAPLYGEHYTEQEIKQLITFYESDLGQKTLRLTPMISRKITAQTRDMSQMALNQAKEEIAFELKKRVKN